MRLLGEGALVVVDASEIKKRKASRKCFNNISKFDAILSTLTINLYIFLIYTCFLSLYIFMFYHYVVFVLKC